MSVCKKTTSIGQIADDTQCIKLIIYQPYEASVRHCQAARLPTDERERYAVVERRDGRPLAGALLTGGVTDLVEQRVTVGVLVLEDVGRDLDQERVQLALVPLAHDLQTINRHLSVTSVDLGWAIYWYMYMYYVVHDLNAICKHQAVHYTTDTCNDRWDKKYFLLL